MAYASESGSHRSSVSEFRKLLFVLSEKLTEQEVDQLKYILLDCIPKGKAEDIKNGRQLFKVLEEAAQLQESKTSILCEVFHTIGRDDLVGEVQSSCMLKSKFNIANL